METTEPAGSAAPVENTGMQATPADPTPAEVEATEVNLDAADDVLKNNSQQAYLETNAPDRANDSGPAITLGAIAAREEKKEEERSQAFEHIQEQIKRNEAHREFMNKEHEFGGMKISGHDLDKLMNFYGNNPQMMDKLRERIVKSGMPKDKIDKGMKEFQEFMDLKKKEQEGQKLTEEEQRRLREIQKSEEFRVTAQEATAYANQQGLALSVKDNKADANAGVSLKGASSSNVDDLVSKKIEAAAVRENSSVLESRSAAYSHFSKAPDVGQKFDQAASGVVNPANNSEPQIKLQVAAVSIAKIEAGNVALM